MLITRVIKPITAMNTRMFKNFGHKRQPEPIFTVLWHGFLTCTFIGIGIEWKRIANFFFGDDNDVEDMPFGYKRRQKEKAEAVRS